MLAPFLPADAVAADGVLVRQVAEWSDRGLRVLLLAFNPDATTLHDAAGQPQLPPLTPLGLVALADELRPQVKETIAAFTDLGIQLKIISGDNPQTVAALAKQAGLPANLRLVSGPELAQLPPEMFDQVAAETTVFGRIAPEQKEQIVDSLLRQGRYVAMMGDGVNDALSLKKAKLGIAMESGSNVTRNVADMILLNDSFAALLPALTEGKRIVGGLSISLYLFLARVVTSMLLIIAIRMIGLGFPYEPSQVALTLFTVGIPTLLLTWWARPETPQPDLLRRLLRFVLPAAIVTTIFGVGIYTFFYTIIEKGVQTTAIPADAVARWEAYTGLTYRADEGFGAAAAAIVAQTALSTFVSFAAFGWFLSLRTIWRAKLFDRLLTVGDRS
jgi:cation-transporting ATPase E